MTITLTANNWETTVGGLLAGIPVIVINSGLMLTPKWTQILSIIGAVGTLLIGLAAKDSGTHYTAAVTLDKEGNYCVGWDDYGSGHALTQVLGPGARKLKQAYAQATTIRYAKSKGWSYEVQTLPNGNQVVNLQTR